MREMREDKREQVEEIELTARREKSGKEMETEGNSEGERMRGRERDKNRTRSWIKYGSYVA